MGNMKFDFAGETAVITGAATGIGRCSAVSFAKAGANVAVCDFNEEKASETVSLCKNEGVQAKFYKMDVTADAAAICAVRDEILQDFREIDILHSNAGIAQKKAGPPMTEIPDSEWEHVFDVNVFGNVKVCREFAEAMKPQNKGKIVITASISAYQPTPFLPVYHMSKVSVLNLMMSLSVELGNYNINVNAVNPGFVYTPIYSEGGALELGKKIPGLQDIKDGETVINAMASQSSLHRAQTPEDIANAVMFLCSDAAREITGQALNVDSGIIRR
jgi:Dehydrogenases with different specificities (related to short-chain alcohol dehydrogenases)